MREILVDYARQRRGAKRDYTCKITLDEALGLSQKREFDLLALDQALERLAQFDPRQGRIVEVRREARFRWFHRSNHFEL